MTIGGNLVYGRRDWMGELAGDAGTAGEAEKVLAWGKPMLLDTTYAAAPSGEEPHRLAQLREILIDRFPQVGPIFA